MLKFLDGHKRIVAWYSFPMGCCIRSVGRLHNLVRTVFRKGSQVGRERIIPSWLKEVGACTALKTLSETNILNLL